MAMLETGFTDLANGTVTNRFVELSDKLNSYLHRFREFGIRSNRAVANYLCVDSAELSRLKNARVGDINLHRGYEILRKCEELSRRLSTFGGPLKCKDVWSVGYNIARLPCSNKREQSHAIALLQQSDAVLLTIDTDMQRSELSMLIGDVLRSVAHPRRNPYGPMSAMSVLKSIYAAPSATQDQLLAAMRITGLGRRACDDKCFNHAFGDDVRLRTLAVINNNGGGIALRIAHEMPDRRLRMLTLSRFLHQASLETFYFAGTIRGSLTSADELRDVEWAQDLLRLLVDREGTESARWPKGIQTDMNDEQEWSFLKENNYWNLIGETKRATENGLAVKRS